MYYQALKKKIKQKKAIVAIVGLGYVGMPLLARFYEKGFNTIGIDIDKKKISDFKKKKLIHSILKIYLRKINLKI